MSQFRDESTLHPEEGARFLFELLSQAQDQERVEYRAAIFTPTEHFEYRVDMDIAGSSAMTTQGQPAPAELEDKLRTLATLVARGASKRRADELLPWPRRILRWRGPGRG